MPASAASYTAPSEIRCSSDWYDSTGLQLGRVRLSQKGGIYGPFTRNRLQPSTSPNSGHRMCHPGLLAACALLTIRLVESGHLENIGPCERSYYQRMQTILAGAAC
jgi:hypothetical protein